MDFGEALQQAEHLLAHNMLKVAQASLANGDAREIEITQGESTGTGRKYLMAKILLPKGARVELMMWGEDPV